MKIFVKVKPCAKADRIEKIDEDNFLVWVKEKPAEGRANKKATEVLAKAFGIARSNVVLLKGQTSRQKVFEIRGKFGGAVLAFILISAFLICGIDFSYSEEKKPSTLKEINIDQGNIKGHANILRLGPKKGAAVIEFPKKVKAKVDSAYLTSPSGKKYKATIKEVPGSKLSDHLNKIPQPDGPKKAPLSFLNGFTRYAYATCGSCGVTEGGQEEVAPRGPRDTRDLAAFSGLLNRAMAEKDKYVTVCEFDVPEEAGEWTLRLDIIDERGKREFIENKFDVVSKGEGEEAQEETREANRTVTRSDGDVIELWEDHYVQIVRRQDGTIIVRLGQTQIEKRQDGSEVVIWPNGTTTTRRRGETELSPGHHVIIEDDGTVIERWPSSGLIIERHPDGTKVTRESNGYTVWRYSDGRVTERFPDKREITRWTDGVETETLANNTEITRYPDHREVVVRPDNTMIERRPLDGVEIESRPADGVVIVRFSYGPIAEIESHRDLTEITRYRDGEETTRHPDGRITTNREVGPGVGRSTFGYPKSRVNPGRKPDIAKSRKKSKKLSEKTKLPHYGCDEWGRPQVWIDKDGDGWLDAVRTYGYDGRPISEIQWRGVTDYQFRIRIYNADGSYTEYIDTDNDGIMDRKVIVDSQGNSREEPTRTLIVYDPAYQSHNVYSNFDGQGRADTMESYDKDGRLRQRITWDENGRPMVETWDANGNPAEAGSWNPARDCVERSRDEFRRGTGLDGNPSPWGGGGADYEWIQGEDGVPRPRGLVRP